MSHDLMLMHSHQNEPQLPCEILRVFMFKMKKVGTFTPLLVKVRGLRPIEHSMHL